MKTLTLSEGTDFTYGQNAQENSQLTRRAHQNHIWLHVSNTSSAHGILHTDNLYNPDIYEAAEIIKNHSKAKDQQNKTKIMCVKVKHVNVMNDNGSVQIMPQAKMKPKSQAKARVVCI